MSAGPIGVALIGFALGWLGCQPSDRKEAATHQPRIVQQSAPEPLD